MFQFISANLGMIICALAGLILVMIEAIMPGFGIAGIAGICAQIAAVVFAWVNHGPTVGLITLFILLLCSLFMILITIRSAKKGRLNRYILKNQESADTSSESLEGLMLKEGTTVTALRPVGTIEIDGKRYEAQSESEFIPAGNHVQIVHVLGNKLTVKRI